MADTMSRIFDVGFGRPVGSVGCAITGAWLVTGRHNRPSLEVGTGMSRSWWMRVAVVAVLAVAGALIAPAFLRPSSDTSVGPAVDEPTAAGLTSPSSVGTPAPGVSAIASLPVTWAGTIAWTKLGRTPTPNGLSCVSGDRLFWIADVHDPNEGGQGLGSSMSVWSSKDATEWTHLADVVTAAVGAYVSLASAAGDGHGGLVVVGTRFSGQSVQAVAWRSADGRAWSKGSVDDSDGHQMLSVVSGHGLIVGVGTDRAFYSTDGSRWSSASLPTTLENPAVVSWNGGYAAVNIFGATTFVAISPDGRTWQSPDQLPASQEIFKSIGLAGFGRRLYVFGSDSYNDHQLPGVRCFDGSGPWQNAVLPSPPDNQHAIVYALVVLDGRAVVLGWRQPKAVPLAASPSNPASTTEPPPTAWISTDGLTWQLLRTTGDVPVYADESSSGSPPALVFGDRIVFRGVDGNLYAAQVRG
jgi:hypothetical protein